jgi:hypothetical protein
VKRQTPIIKAKENIFVVNEPVPFKSQRCLIIYTFFETVKYAVKMITQKHQRLDLTQR